MASETVTNEPGALRCAQHPNVETYLRCGRCDTPICPRCLVQTPVGARCRACARVRASPPYDVSPLYALRAGGAALAGALFGGVALQYAIRFVQLGWIGQVLFGVLYGMGVARLVGLVTNRKRGPLLGWISVIAITLGYCLSRAAFVYLRLPVPHSPERLFASIALGFQLDLNVLLLLIAAGIMAYNRLR
jgi:hypothetical protein